jgi:hypothetical protein
LQLRTRACLHRGLASAHTALLLNRCRLDQDRRHRLAAPPRGLEAMDEIDAAGVLDALDE